MDTILIVDVDPARADEICELLRKNDVPAERCQNLPDIQRTIQSSNCPAVIVAHCAMLDRSFSQLAMLRHDPRVKLIFYCTDPGQRSPGRVPQLPEELTEVILRITESRRKLMIAG